MADFRKVVRHKRTKSVIETRLYYQILAKFEYAKRSGSNNAHATDIYYPERENYIPRKREWLLLIHLRGQCEKPDSVDEQDTVLTLFAYNNLNVPTGDEEQWYAMKKFIIVFLLLVGVTFVAVAQSLVTRCKVLNNTTFQYEWTECYVRFDAPHETIKLTFPHSLTLYVKSVESLSAGRLDLLAMDSDGLYYNLYFTDFSGLVGSPTMQFWIKKKSGKKEAYTYYYFFNPEVVIPILNEFLEKL